LSSACSGSVADATPVGGDVAASFAELENPSTEGQMRVRALDPELVWLAHEHEPWRPGPA
jgi:N-acyl homoserine lactone hydrolase